jgi:hypothetical protein
MSKVRRHHRLLVGRRIAITMRVAITHVRVSWRCGTHSRIRAAEASSAALEIGEAAWWAGPIARARTVLWWRERSEDLSSTIKDAIWGRRDFDSLLVEGTTIHAKTLSSL